MRSTPASAGLLAALALTITLPACGVASYQPGRVAAFDVNGSEAEIDDEDIRKAFEARPQFPSSAVNVAYYTFDPQVAKDLDTTLGALPGVANVYRISPLLVTGQRRLNEASSRPPQEISMKKLRLLAARARADVLIIVDHGYHAQGINVLSSFNILILPILFLPWLDTTVEGYAEAFVVDVRNGYLYGHVVEEDKRGEAFATIYAKDSHKLAEEQWASLRDALRKDLGRLIEEERGRSGAAAAPRVAEGGVKAP